MDLCHVDVTVTDDHGVVVYSADHEVTWTIEGPARLLGIESGDPASHESYKANKRRVFHGRELGYIQSTQESGGVKIRLSSPGLLDAAMTLQTAS
jgi:beta-galactosidase